MGFLKTLTCLTLLATVQTKQDFSKRVTNFSFELLYYTGLETDAHTVISPFGIWSLMAAIAQGTDGRSYEQLRRALNLPKGRKELFNGYKLLSGEVRAKSRGITLQQNNFMFTDINFNVNQDFKQQLRSTFDTVVVPLGFQNRQTSAKSANEVIARATNQHIREALSSDDFEDAQMILTNVIYFKGLWNAPFNVTNTKVEPFYDENYREIGQVKMMYQRSNFPYTNMKSLGGYVLEVPYGEDNRLSMLVILPYPGVPLLDMFQKFQNVDLNDIFISIDRNKQDFGEEEVDCWLPRFQISTNVVLNKPLQDLGIFDIFDPYLANFTMMTNSPVFVSKVVHKADIEVTESGTVAAAVTSSVISNRNTPVDFKVNRPFIYLVLEKMSSTVIFGGVYSKPSIF